MGRQSKKSRIYWRQRRGARRAYASRRGRALHGLTRQVTLADFARAHFVAKAESRKFTEHWLEVTEKCLGRAVEFFGADRDPRCLGSRSATCRSTVAW